MDTETYLQKLADMFLILHIPEILKFDKIDHRNPLVKDIKKKINRWNWKYKNVYEIFSNNSKAKKHSILILRIILNNIGISLIGKKLAHNKKPYFISGEALEEFRKLTDEQQIKEWFLTQYHKYGKPIKRGIYKVVCVPTGNFYIGRSKQLKTRMKSHEYKLNNKQHNHKDLQELSKKYGADNFIIEIVERSPNYIKKEEELIKENKSSPLLLNPPTRREVRYIPFRD